MASDVESRVRKIIAENSGIQIPVEQIGPEEHLGNLGVNSIAFIKMSVVLETEFGIEFNDEDLTGRNIHNIKGLVAYIEERL